MAEDSNINKIYRSVIDYSLNKFRDHSGINKKAIIRWLSQFPPDNRDLAKKVLHSIQYYSGSEISTMTNKLVQAIYRNNSSIDKSKIFFVPIGGPGSGSQIIARHLKSLQIVSRDNIIDLLYLSNMDPNDVEMVVFFDDFSGTGRTILEWWETIDPLILPLDAITSIGVLVLNYKAYPILMEIIDKIFFISELDPTFNVLHLKNNHFTKNEKSLLTTLCDMTNCSKKFRKGFGDCGLLVAFKHGCPNNSLPILWYDGPNWIKLFSRRNI